MFFVIRFTNPMGMKTTARCTCSAEPPAWWGPRWRWWTGGPGTIGGEDNLVTSFHQADKRREAACKCVNNNKANNNRIIFFKLFTPKIWLPHMVKHLAKHSAHFLCTVCKSSRAVEARRTCNNQQLQSQGGTNCGQI